jgi:hypothetical protein
MIKMFILICTSIALALNIIMSDANNIYKLYAENAAQPQMTIEASGAKKWWLNGALHRDDGPAIKFPDGDEAWYQHGKLHRDGEPAVTGRGGYKAWYQHGKMHREDGPAIEWPSGAKEWYLNGVRHNEGGPAIEYDDGAKSWYLHGRFFHNAHQWAQAVLEMHNKPHDAAAIERFLRDILTRDDLI